MHTQNPLHLRPRFFLLVLMISAVFAVLRPMFCQDVSIGNKIHQSVANISKETEGAKLYTTACATCHGADGKGNGPVAASLNTRPTDLTLLSQANGGNFPTEHIQYVLSSEWQDPVHGSKEMPVWGPIFRRSGGAGNTIAFLRCHNVTEYLRSIQVK